MSRSGGAFKVRTLGPFAPLRYSDDELIDALSRIFEGAARP
jgi:hypothetical protein